MNLRDFPITYPYGATTSPYSTTSPHRGSDRKCPIGTPIVIGDTTIALTGNTGLSSGPHCHIQAWVGTVSQTRNPAPYEFKPGTVKAVGVGPQWGSYITIDVGGVNCTYAHLSKVNVTVGQVIGGDEMITKRLLEIVMGMAWGGSPSQADIDNWVGKNELANMLMQFEIDQRRKDYFATVQKGFACLNKPASFAPVTEQLYRKS